MTELDKSRFSRSQTIDVQRNRQAQKWTRKQLFGRLLWEILRGPVFAWTPRQIWIWRRIVLRIFGARIGVGAHIHPSVLIAVPWNLEVGEYTAIGEGANIYSLGKIVLERNAMVSQGAHLCAGTHDYRLASFPLVRAPITIGEGAWVCADAFIGPNVTIGARSVVGARAVVTKDVPAETIVAGNPAKAIKARPVLASQ